MTYKIASAVQNFVHVHKHVQLNFPVRCDFQQSLVNKVFERFVSYEGDVKIDHKMKFFPPQMKAGDISRKLQQIIMFKCFYSIKHFGTAPSQFFEYFRC